METAFISYSNKDREFTNRLAKDLGDAGVNIFYDQLVEPGESWVNMLFEAVQRAKYLIIIITPNYLKSKWTQEELNIGLVRESKGEAKVIPIFLKDCDLPPPISTKAYIDFRGGYDEPLEVLINVLKGKKGIGKETTKKFIDVEESRIKNKKNQEGLDHFLKKPIAESQVFSEKKGKTCFIIMPFSEPDLNDVYEAIVKPAVQELSITCERGDDESGSNMVMDDIMNSIMRTDIIVADLTRKNANVFYEVGIAHALNKPVLLLSQSLDDVPFDLRHRRILLYQNTAKGGKDLDKKLKQSIESMFDAIKKALK